METHGCQPSFRRGQINADVYIYIYVCVCVCVCVCGCVCVCLCFLGISAMLYEAGIYP